MDFFAHILIFFFIYALAAIGLSYCIHAAGVFSLGHSAFFGIGAYTAALTSINLDWQFLPALAIAGVVASVASVIISFCAIRLKEDYVAVATLALMEVTRQVFYNWNSLTNGAYGLGGIPPARLFTYEFSRPFGYLIISAIMFVLGAIVIRYIQNSPVGLMILAAKNDSTAAQMMGMRPNLLRMGALCLSAGFAGLAGAEYSFYVNYIHPNDFGLNQSIMFLAFSILATERRIISGCLIGLVFYFVLSESLRPFNWLGTYKANIIQIVTALIIFFVVIYRGKRHLEMGRD